MGTKKYVEWGFGDGESEYEVSFGLSTHNGELSPSVHETPEPLSSPFWARNPELRSDSNSPQNLRSVGQNLGAQGIHPEIKGQCFYIFLKIANVVFLLVINDKSRKLNLLKVKKEAIRFERYTLTCNSTPKAGGANRQR